MSFNGSEREEERRQGKAGHTPSRRPPSYRIVHLAGAAGYLEMYVHLRPFRDSKRALARLRILTRQNARF